MIYTSYFGKLKNLPENIIPVSICGKAPDWYKGLRYKKLAPKYDFFMKWKETKDNDYYIDCFNELVLKPLNARDIVGELQGITPYGTSDIALICYEKPGDFCHRHLVADWLNNNGFRCEEYEIKAQWILPSKGQIFYPCNYICSQCGYDSGVRCFWQTKEIKRCSGCNALMG